MYLNNIHIRTARNLLNLGVRQLGTLIYASRTTISKLENNIIALSNMKLGNRRNVILNEFFKTNGIYFPNYYTLTLDLEKFPNVNNTILTSYQIKGARIILQKTQLEISSEAKTGISVVRRLENNESSNDLAISCLKTIFEKHGIIFPNNFSIAFKTLVDMQTSKC